MIQVTILKLNLQKSSESVKGNEEGEQFIIHSHSSQVSQHC